MIQDYRAAVQSALAGRSVYWLAKESTVPQPVLQRWLAGTRDTINTAQLAKVAGVLKLKLKKEKR